MSPPVRQCALTLLLAAELLHQSINSTADGHGGGPRRTETEDVHDLLDALFLFDACDNKPTVPLSQLPQSHLVACAELLSHRELQRSGPSARGFVVSSTDSGRRASRRASSRMTFRTVNRR